MWSEKLLTCLGSSSALQLWAGHQAGFVHAWHQIPALLWLLAATLWHLEPGKNPSAAPEMSLLQTLGESMKLSWPSVPSKMGISVPQNNNHRYVCRLSTQDKMSRKNLCCRSDVMDFSVINQRNCCWKGCLECEDEPAPLWRTFRCRQGAENGTGGRVRSTVPGPEGPPPCEIHGQSMWCIHKRKL